MFSIYKNEHIVAQFDTEIEAKTYILLLETDELDENLEIEFVMDIRVLQ